MKLRIQMLFILVCAGLWIIGCNSEDTGDMLIMPEVTKFENSQHSLAKAEANLNILALQIAQVLNDADIRDVLRFKIETAETREKILDFGKLATQTVVKENKTIAELMVSSAALMKTGGSSSTLSVEEIKKMIDEVKPMVDIYFPVKAHRKEWLKNKGELLVAFTPLTIDDRDWETITAYTLNGEKRLLDAREIPQEPVLVISRCEHRGNHTPPVAAPLDCNEPAESPCGGGGGGGGTSEPTWRIRVTDFRLLDDHEPPLAGSPEIYVLVEHIIGDVRRTDFPEVDDEITYYENNYSWLPKVIYSEPYNGNYDPNHNTKVEVWEDDGWGTFGDDNLETIWHLDTPDGQLTDFQHLYSLGYEHRTWYYGDNNDADLRMYVNLDNPSTP